jgi:integrase/recombinase XerD
MKFDVAIDAFIADLRGYGQINSQATEKSYREKLAMHAADCGGRPVEKTGKNDVKRTLRRWQHPNSKNQAHSVLNSFYRWTVEEDIRTTNPAQAVRRARKSQPQINRLTREETSQLLDWAASSDARHTERWLIYLGICAGLRCKELAETRVEDVMRPGWVHVARTAGKGAKERWVPVIRDLQPIIDEIKLIGPEHGTLLRPRERATLPSIGEYVEVDRPMARNSIYRLVKAAGRKAGLYQPVTPHTLRHAFGDHIAKYAGLRVAQALLGHESVETTAGTYVDRVSMDEMSVAVSGFSFFSRRDSENEAGVSLPQTAFTARGDDDVR